MRVVEAGNDAASMPIDDDSAGPLSLFDGPGRANRGNGSAAHSQSFCFRLLRILCPDSAVDEDKIRVRLGKKRACAKKSRAGPGRISIYSSEAKAPRGSKSTHQLYFRTYPEFAERMPP